MGYHGKIREQELDREVRRFFDVDEKRYERLDMTPYRANWDPSIRNVRYRFTATHRAIMGLIRALLSCQFDPFRGGAIGSAVAC